MSEARNLGETAFVRERGQPSAEIVRVGCAKPTVTIQRCSKDITDNKRKHSKHKAFVGNERCRWYTNDTEKQRSKVMICFKKKFVLTSSLLLSRE